MRSAATFDAGIESATSSHPAPEFKPHDDFGSHDRSSPALFRSALQAGLLGVLANLIPFGLGMILTGILAALLHHRSGSESLTTRAAARLGAMAGAIAFVASSILTGFLIVALHLQQQFRDLMMKAVEERAGPAPDADMQAALQWLHTSEGLAIALLLTLFILLALSMFAAAVSSAVTVAVTRSKGANRP